MPTLSRICGNVVVMIELGGGTNPFSTLIHNFFWPLQGFINVFIFFVHESNQYRRQPEMYHYFLLPITLFFFTMKFTGHQNGRQPSHNVGQPKKVERPIAQRSLYKSFREESDDISTPQTHAGMNETTGEKATH
jgi:hypothetical protein